MIKLSSIPQFSRNAKRFKEILAILFKYGLATWIKDTDPKFIKGIFKDPQGEALTDLSLEVRIRMALSELGTTFIKLGQILSTRADIIGPTLATELEKLQANAPEDSAGSVKKLIKAELGQPVEKLFESFDEKPIASASIGQVHLATLKQAKVVVKVQHTGVQKVIETDLSILSALADLAEKYSEELKLYQSKAIVEEFKRSLLKELDFKKEARHLNQFRANFKSDDSVRFPRPFAKLTSKRVLTMEKIQGISVAQTDILLKQGLDTEELAQKGALIFLDMIFRDGFYHADPHPGNIWILPNGSICILDCGQTGRLDEATREKLEDMLLAALNRDLESLTETLCRLGTTPQNLKRSMLMADLGDFMDEYVGIAISDIDITSMLNALTDIIRRHRIMLPTNVSMLLKVMVMLEGTSTRLNPKFNLVELLQPYSVDAIQRRLSPARILKKLQRSFKDWEYLLETLPNDLANIMRLVKAGRFDVNLEHRRLDTTINRLIYGILTASIFLGSCIILAGKLPPLIKGVSIPGALGCVVAFILGWRLLSAIHNSGDLN